MVSSVAVLSDIHGVMPALDAVLAEPDLQRADRERWAEVLGDLPPEVMTVVCGHTHMPFTRLANTRQIINPGSVGMPYGRQGAHWAILSGGAVEMRRTVYDPVAACTPVPPTPTP